MATRPVHLRDFTALSQRCHETASGFAAFRNDEAVKALNWPDDVVEQWLYDHAGFDNFLLDYGHVDLAVIRWHEEDVPADQFRTMPTGPSESDVIGTYAMNPDHWVSVRSHQGVPQHWELHRTWLRRPLLIERALLRPPGEGLQVIEGRTRVGVLRGFLELGRDVAATHAVWVARSSADTGH